MSAALAFGISRLVLTAAIYAVMSTWSPEYGDIHLAVPPADWRVALFLVAGALVSTLFFALAPALQATRVELVQAMRGEVMRDARPGRARNRLICLQVTASALLLICATVFLRSTWASATADSRTRTAEIVNVDVLNEQRRGAVLEAVRSELSVASVAATANPLWGVPHIHGELLKLGLTVSESTVAKYLRRRPRPPSQTWQTFLTNHASQIMAADLFVVPTVTFRLLFVLVILAHDRRRVVHVAVTEHPTAAWTAQQLRNAFPENESPWYLLHDRDSVFAHVATTIGAMNTQAIRTAPRAPWQNAYVERIIGSIRRECLDHVIVMNAAGLHRVIASYVACYMRSRTHLALGKDTPLTRPISPPSDGRIVATPEVGRLHHRYDRIAA